MVGKISIACAKPCTGCPMIVLNNESPRQWSAATGLLGRVIDRVSNGEILRVADPARRRHDGPTIHRMLSDQITLDHLDPKTTSHILAGDIESLQVAGEALVRITKGECENY